MSRCALLCPWSASLSERRRIGVYTAAGRCHAVAGLVKVQCIPYLRYFKVRVALGLSFRCGTSRYRSSVERWKGHALSR